MLGLMQERPLLISSLIEYAALNHGRREIVSRLGDRSIHRYTFSDLNQRSKQLAQALTEFGVRQGDRIATLAWSTYRHLECFYGISGMGAVCHTVNPRLFEDQLAYILNHAEDKVLLFDPDQIDLVVRLAPKLQTVKTLVALGTPAELPSAEPLPGLRCYETLLNGHSGDFTWPSFDERTASSLCYTSGTTGNPKGVVYGHRSTVLHAMASLCPDNLGLSSKDVVMGIAPMFHANGWSLPYGVAMSGAKFVMPGRHLDPESIIELIKREEVTFTAAVPTVWTMLLNHLQQHGGDLEPLRRCVIGGTALSQTIRDTFRDRYGVNVAHLWGMTETSPIGTVGVATAEVDQLAPDERDRQLLKQGRLIYGLEMKIVDKDGRPAPRDGKAFGDIWVRGPWVARGYLKDAGGDALDEDGWFRTGDVGTIDAFGYMQITDRSKDVIKSGGEWISSIELENIAQGHPSVDLAAVVAARHPKWDERPILVVTAAPGQTPEPDALTDYLRDKVAKWWLPDDVIVIDAMPLTATGKILKAELRARFADHLEKRLC